MIVPKISVEHTKGNKRYYSYLYPIGDLAQGNFYVWVQPKAKECHKCEH
jgi:hypothetical protein